MYWLIGIVIVFIIAFIIIKLAFNTDENPDSQLGILEHPSAFEKSGIERVDKAAKKDDVNTLEL
ncbi:hypothetical protein [Winogradskyella sp. 3972H.M.0a.05]|uniref:hypothetical protein n=1 Tax=Winogradskyella sp. 3972H.M.0a.05 TaxID=2950277 RepID=UPI0033947477